MKASLLTLTICLIIIPAHAKYSGGTGDPNDPYQIATAEDLMLLGESSEDYDKHFILTADIDLDPNLPGRKIFDRAVIAADVDPNDYGDDFQGTPFTGVLDGNSHTISHLTIVGAGYLGLFGRLGSGSEVKGLGILDPRIVDSGYYVGGLAGVNYGGTVTYSYSNGSVSGWDFVGGLLGGNGGIVTNCYSTSMVSGNVCVGGLVGVNSVPHHEIPPGLGAHHSLGLIAHCYSTGAVGDAIHVGGLLGLGSIDYVTASFWDIETSGLMRSDGGTGLTTAEMQTASTFLDTGWDFVEETANSTEDIWWILEGQSYPRLWWQYGRAFSPYPQDGAVDVVQPLILSWLPGGPSLQHDIYLGEDIETVAHATTESTGVYRGRRIPEMTTYDPGTLELDKTYYWRVDEIGGNDPNSMHKGNVWSFATANFLIVDDFENYKDYPPHEIWNRWIDGWGTATNGSTVNILSDIDPYFNPDLWGFNVRVPQQAASEMGVGLPQPACRSRLQTAVSGFGQEPWS